MSTIAIVHSFIYGPKNAMQPTGSGKKPAMFSSAPFDLDAMTPIEAAGVMAYRWHKIQPHPSHWRIVHEHTVSPNAFRNSRTKRNPAYQKVFVMEYLPERTMRKHRGVDDDELHAFLKSSWYIAETETN